MTVFWKTDHLDTRTEIHLLPVHIYLCIIYINIAISIYMCELLQVYLHANANLCFTVSEFGAVLAIEIA